MARCHLLACDPAVGQLSSINPWKTCIALPWVCIVPGRGGGSRASPGRAEPWRSFTIKTPRERNWSQLEEVQSGISYKSSLLQLKRESLHTSTVPNSGKSPRGVEAGWHHEEKEWIHMEGDASELNSWFCQLSCALQSRAGKGWAPREVQDVSFLLVIWVQFWDREPVGLLNKHFLLTLSDAEEQKRSVWFCMLSTSMASECEVGTTAYLSGVSWVSKSKRRSCVLPRCEEPLCGHVQVDMHVDMHSIWKDAHCS